MSALQGLRREAREHYPVRVALACDIPHMDCVEDGYCRDGEQAFPCSHIVDVRDICPACSTGDDDSGQYMEHELVEYPCARSYELADLPTVGGEQP